VYYYCAYDSWVRVLTMPMSQGVGVCTITVSPGQVYIRTQC
jgi:hypothetical protein